MADTVTSNVIFSGSVKHIVQCTNVSDGTGEAAVQKVDISTLTKKDGSAPTAVKILKAKYSIHGMSVKVAFDHTADDTALILSGTGEIDFTESGGLHDPASAGGTGDIVFTTIGAVANDTYDITLTLGLS